MAPRRRAGSGSLIIGSQLPGQVGGISSSPGPLRIRRGWRERLFIIRARNPPVEGRAGLLQGRPIFVRLKEPGIPRLTKIMRAQRRVSRMISIEETPPLLKVACSLTSRTCLRPPSRPRPSEPRSALELAPQRTRILPQRTRNRRERTRNPRPNELGDDGIADLRRVRETHQVVAISGKWQLFTHPTKAENEAVHELREMRPNELENPPQTNSGRRERTRNPPPKRTRDGANELETRHQTNGHDHRSDHPTP